MPGPLSMRSFALATDLYELTMAAAYFCNRISAVATFELFVRELPPARRFLLVAGLDQALDYLEALRFSPEDIDYLRRHPSFSTVPSAFFDYLGEFRFEGEVWAMPEGTVAFPPEPLLRVTAPILQAQIVETFLLATINFQTMIASKAARVVTAARGRPVIEFGSRRAHGSEAAMLAARAAFIGGCTGTSNVEAGLCFGVPTFGTIAHSWIMSFDDELAAFEHYTRVFPHATTLLIDTYDTLAAARKIVAAGLKPQAVRLDSGELAALSVKVREILDAGGLTATRIFASGDLDEYRIAELLQQGAPIDAFGVGTRLSTSADAPNLGGVYKLVEVQADHQRKARVKTSPGKVTLPGRKQVWRTRSADGHYDEDWIALADEPPPAPQAEPLLQLVMRNGQRTTAPIPVQEIRERALQNLDRLPEPLRELTPGPGLLVRVTPRLLAEQERAAAKCVGR
ncbi:MAG: nicotinate phosphoribosyltransferase [Candidatus Binatia bacterium]|nr:MAG: nicotinate phosphoribosyltransferase [Candidatus Binatia bacterium]